MKYFKTLYKFQEDFIHVQKFTDSADMNDVKGVSVSIGIKDDKTARISSVADKSSKFVYGSTKHRTHKLNQMIEITKAEFDEVLYKALKTIILAVIEE